MSCGSDKASRIACAHSCWLKHTRPRPNKRVNKIQMHKEMDRRLHILPGFLSCKPPLLLNQAQVSVTLIANHSLGFLIICCSRNCLQVKYAHCVCVCKGRHLNPTKFSWLAGQVMFEQVLRAWWTYANELILQQQCQLSSCRAIKQASKGYH